jgi:hypothetical protein
MFVVEKQLFVDVVKYGCDDIVLGLGTSYLNQIMLSNQYTYE